MNKAELLAPAGNFEKLKTAFLYGADAVYLGGKAFSLRSFADNFTEEELERAIAYAHERGKKVYVCANIFARNSDFSSLPAYFRSLEAMGADAVLISDLGVFSVCREAAPRLPVHVSTQANTTNGEAVKAWRKLGAERVVLARELSLQEIAEIHAAAPDIELEAFVHGAMCISYSGRCLLSDYLDGRSSNRGACVQACRFSYEIRAKEGKSGEWLTLEEDGKGAYLLNSKDLNMSAYLNELAAAGVSSFKIEGRMKSDYYLATVVNAYRRLLDGSDERIAEELECAAHRDYTTAYMLGENAKTVSRENSQTKGTCEFIAVVKGYENGRALVEMRNRFYEGEELEILSPYENFKKCVTVCDLREGELPAPDAKKVQAIYSFACPFPLFAGEILRRRKNA